MQKEAFAEQRSRSPRVKRREKKKRERREEEERKRVQES